MSKKNCWLHSLIRAVEPECKFRKKAPHVRQLDGHYGASGARIFAFLVCLFGFWFLNFDSASAGWTSGKFGSAISFNGTSNYVSSNSSLPAASAFSYSLWFKSSDGAYAANEYLFSQGTNSPSVYIGATNGKINLMADNALKITSNKTFLDANWHHLEITADGTSLKLYLDGILESSAAYAGSSADGLLYVASNATPGSYFGGIIDDVKVYAYARTSDEVLVDYNSGKAAHLGKNNQRDDGLVGFWNMEEGTGQTVYDRSGNGNNGILGGTTAVQKSDPVFTSGYSSAGAGGTGLKFDGKDDYVNCGSNASLNITQNITVEAWVKLNNSAVSNRIVSKHGSGHGWTFGNNGNKILFGFSTTGADWNEWLGNTSLSSSVWYHLAAVRDYTNSKVYFYLNGVSDRTPVDFSGQINIAGANTRIGIDCCCGGTGCPFNGSIDEVRVYNRALSADEIRQHYNQKKPVLEMKFDEGSGQKAYDESFNNNDGWLGGTSAVEATDPTWTTGKFGSGLSFDGGDYIQATVSQTKTTYSVWYDSGSGWQHLVKIGSNYYINGSLASSPPVFPIYTSGNTIQVGRNEAGGYVSGKVDEVRIYNYARALAEILVDYNNGLAGHLR